MPLAVITGSSGLVGSACVAHFSRLGWRTIGIDNGQRRRFFGADGDNSAVNRRLAALPRFTAMDADICDAGAIDVRLKVLEPDLLIHCAAQPSHDYATAEPYTDWMVNAVGTMNVLEATRKHAPEAVFCFASTNKVYGDSPNELPLKETETRWDVAIPGFAGIDETMRIDRCRHSIFGASKLAADVMVQEYAKTFGLRTGVFRFGCLTGAAHAGAEQHGFLSYLARCFREGRPYRIYGYKGKQVRDQLHATDVATAFAAFAADPRPGEVYNLGGGYRNSVSVREAIDAMRLVSGKSIEASYVNEPRGGDHICYYSDTRKFQAHYPEWRLEMPLDSIIEELCRPH